MPFTDGLPGGAQKDLTTTEIYVNLAPFAEKTVSLWSVDGDIWFCFARVGTVSGTLVTAGDQDPSSTALVADRAGKGRKVRRRVSEAYSVLVVRMVTGTGTLKVKVTGDSSRSSSDAEETAVASDVSISGVLPSALGQTTMANSLPVVIPSNQSDLPIKQGTPAKTDNLTYIATGNMSGDVTGLAIAVGPEGRLLVRGSWSNTGSPIGLFVLQGLAPDGSNYEDVPGSSAAFLRHPNADTSTTMAYFRDLQVFVSVRVIYRRTSGGTANTTLDVDTRTM